MSLDTSGLSVNSSMRDIFDWCKARGIESLAQGMIELPPPDLLRNIAGALLAGDDGHTYRTRRGEPQYLKALQKMLREVYHTDVPEEAILATSGVTGAIVASLHYAHKRGVRKVGLTNPFYTYHGKHIEIATQSKPVFVELDHAGGTFDFDWASLEQQIVDGMGALIVCNPGNPSGRVYSKDELNKLVEVTRDRCILILDEIYADLVWDPARRPFYSPVQDTLHRHVIACRGFSKNVATQSWRVGYLVSHPDTVAAVLTEHDPLYISVPILQHAIGRYLDEHLDDYVAHVQRSNAIMKANLKLLGDTLTHSMGWTLLPPDGSMYAMFRHSEPTDFDAVVKALRKGVGVAAGSMFFKGTPAHTGFIRIHVGLDAERVKSICAVLNANTSK